MDPFTASLVAGGVGSMIDAGLGIYNDHEDRKRARRARNELTKGIDKAGEIYQSTYDDAKLMYDPYAEQGLDAWAKMRGMEGEFDPSKFKSPEMGEFEFDESVDRYLDPSMAFQQKEAMRGLQGSAAAAGGLLSGKTLKDIQSRGTELARQDYGNAFDRMTGDRTFAYQDYLNRFKNERQNVADRYSMVKDKYDRLAGQSDVGRWATGEQAGLRTGLGDSQANLAAARANAQAQYQSQTPSNDQSWWKGVGGAVRGATPLLGGALSGAFSGTPRSKQFVQADKQLEMMDNALQTMQNRPQPSMPWEG